MISHYALEWIKSLIMEAHFTNNDVLTSKPKLWMLQL